MRGPNCYREANPRRLLFDSHRDYRTRNKYNGEVSLRDGELGPRISMRGFMRRAGCDYWV
jgi:hypothetical protein